MFPNAVLASIVKIIEWADLYPGKISALFVLQKVLC